MSTWRSVSKLRRIAPSCAELRRVARSCAAHRLLVPLERRLRRLGVQRDRVADARVRHRLDPAVHVAHLAAAQHVDGRLLPRRHRAHLEHLVRGAARHEAHLVTLSDLAVDHPDLRDDAAVRVVVGVEDQRAQRRRALRRRRGDFLDDCFSSVSLLLELLPPGSLGSGVNTYTRAALYSDEASFSQLIIT